MELDEDLGSWPESFTQEHHGVYLFWHYLAVVTSTIAMAIATAVVAHRAGGEEAPPGGASGRSG